MDTPIYIIGHKNPDTDSIVSAMAYKELKERLGCKNVIAGRLGELNRETRFLLKYFHREAPPRIHTLRTQISDLELDPIYPVQQDASIHRAWSSMSKERAKTLPIINKDGDLLGIVSAGDLARMNMEYSLDRSFVLQTTIQNLLDTLSAKSLIQKDETSLIAGKVIVAAMSSSVLKKLAAPGDLIIVGDSPELQLAAVKCDPCCVVTTDSCRVSSHVMTLADAHRCAILNTPYDSFTAARLIYQSIPVSSVMKTADIVSFHPEDFLDEIKEIMLDTRYRSYPVINSDGSPAGMISRYHLIRPRKKKVILVDHNETSQSVQGLEQAEILEIIDHHRIADVQTGLPVYFRNQPVGSTSTIVSQMFFEHRMNPSPSTAGLLCGAILSDTVLFKSPTAAPVDKETAKRLADIAKVDLDSFGHEMFKSTTSISGKTLEEIFYSDFKEFSLSGRKIGVSQISTMNLEELNPLQNDLLHLMQTICSNQGFDLIIMMITDILKEGSELLFTGRETNLIAKAFNTDVKGSSLFLPGVISRKKQIIPPISGILG